MQFSSPDDYFSQNREAHSESTRIEWRRRRRKKEAQKPGMDNWKLLRDRANNEYTIELKQITNKQKTTPRD